MRKLKLIIEQDYNYFDDKIDFYFLDMLLYMTSVVYFIELF